MHAPAVISASTPAAVYGSRPNDNAIAPNVSAAIVQTPAASPSTPSMKLTMFITATIPITVSPYANGGDRSRRPVKGTSVNVTRTPATTGTTAASVGPSSLNSAD